MKYDIHSKHRWFNFRLIGVACLSTMLLWGGVGCESGGGSKHDKSRIDFGDNDPYLYVAIGDSITGDINNGVVPYPPRLAAMLQQTVINEGRGGETSGGGASRVKSVLSRHKPGYLLILYGANDLLHGRDKEDTINNLRYIIRAAKDNKTVPVISTLTPMTGSYHLWDTSEQRLSNAIRNLAHEEGAWLVDAAAEFDHDRSYMSFDGLHPNDAGCQLLALAFYDEIS